MTIRLVKSNAELYWVDEAIFSSRTVERKVWALPKENPSRIAL